MLQPSQGSLGFIVQQGFPESSQSYFLEAYFERLTQRLQRDYMGTAIKGGVEGLQLQPAKEQEKILAPFVELVGSVLESGQMSAPILAKLADKGYLSKGMLFMFRLLAPTGLIHSYWDRQLKQNEAFEQRFDRPYRESVMTLESGKSRSACGHDWNYHSSNCDPGHRKRDRIK
jgi:hypothetical protein